jgi:voltage-gated potassium channel
LRGLRLLRIVGAANRGMNALRRTMRRRGLGYALSLTVGVTLLGAAGMLAFEPASATTPGFSNFADALWWTAMVITTMGTDFWPRTPEGRVLCLLLAVYGFAIFGYITASFASFFIGQDARSPTAEVAGAKQLARIEKGAAAAERAVSGQPTRCRLNRTLLFTTVRIAEPLRRAPQPPVAPRPLRPGEAPDCAGRRSPRRSWSLSANCRER